jgi:hypothetical protein
MHAIYERITVAGPEIVGVRLTQAAYAHGLALPEKVELARPTGVGRALATYEIPIEGRDEWLAAAESAGMRNRPTGYATDREVRVVAAVLAAGSEKAAATTAPLAWIVASAVARSRGLS